MRLFGYRASVIIMVAVSIGVAVLSSEPTIDPTSLPDLNDHTCDLEDAVAPRLAGTPLFLFATILQLPVIGPLIIRQLMNENGFPDVRRFAAKLKGVMPIHYPVVEVSEEKHQEPGCLLEICAPSTVPYTDNPVSLRSHRKGVRDYTQAYRVGTTTPFTVIQSLIRAQTQSDEGERPLRAFIQMGDVDELEAQAVASGERWALGEPLSDLDGVPVAVKDEVNVKGFPLTMGTAFLGAKGVAGADALPVARLRAMGAIIVGKTNMHEIGIGTTGHNAHHGAPRNPYNTAHYTGGSSSGSAVAVASGLTPIALGCDGGGSIRIPSALCGLVGLKPTFARIPMENDLDPSVGHVGPMAVDAASAALMYMAMAGGDESNSHSLKQPLPNINRFDDITDLSDVKIGVFWDLFEMASPDVVAANKHMLDKFVGRGAKIVNVTIPHLFTLQKAHTITILSEMARAMDPHFMHHEHEFASETRINLALARALSGRDVMAAAKVRGFFMDVMKQVFEDVDVLATPTTAITAPPIPADAVEKGESNLLNTARLMRFSGLANFVGTPSISFPIGQTSITSDSENTRGVGEGLPIGMQLTGRWWEEHTLLRLAHASEHLTTPLGQPMHHHSPPL